MLPRVLSCRGVFSLLKMFARFWALVEDNNTLNHFNTLCLPCQAIWLREATPPACAHCLYEPMPGEKCMKCARFCSSYVLCSTPNANSQFWHSHTYSKVFVMGMRPLVCQNNRQSWPSHTRGIGLT